MLFTVGKELKQSVGDQLRGVRYLVRMLGSDTQRPGLATQALPEVPPELDRLVGRTFRAVDGVMTAVESAASPFRSAGVPVPGFAPVESYFGKDADGASKLVEDIYAALKIVASEVTPNPLLLKSRLAGVHGDLAAARKKLPLPQDLCAALFLSLMRYRPLVKTQDADDEAAMTKQYIAVTLIFGLMAFEKVQREEASAIVVDALLLAGTRLETLVSAAKVGSPDGAVARTFETLLGHLA